MKNKAALGTLRWILFVFIAFFFSLSLTSCGGSEDSGTAYLAIQDDTSFIYNEAVDRTSVSFVARIENESILGIKEEKLTLSLLLGGSEIDRKTYYFGVTVGAIDATESRFNFSYAGRIDGLELVSWSASFASFWETYQAWLIVTIVVAAIAAIIYVIYIFVQDFELSDVFEFIGENIWILAILAFSPLSTLISRFVTGVWNWTLLLIVAGGIVAFVLIALLAHLVKYFIDEARFGFAPPEIIGNACGLSVEECLDSREDLERFNKKQLIDYCRQNAISGYSGLNKAGVISLIMSGGMEPIDKDETGSGKKEVAKTAKDAAKQGITFDDIAGLEEAKKAFNEKVVLPMEHPEIYEKYGKKRGGGILLYGLPGTGKTMFAEASANALDALFIPIKCSDIKSKWYGESEQNVKGVFEKARKAKKAIIFFDEFEAIGAKRTDDSNNGNNDLVPEILAEMQGVGTDDGSMVMILAATNKPWSIDSAFMRPGRFDERIYIPLPDYEARKKLFELKLKKVPKKDLDYDRLAKVTEGFNGADIAAFVESLKQIAINESIKTDNEHIVDRDDVASVEKTAKTSVSAEDIDAMKEFEASL
ncbi:MAG: ATP-binding protein [Bacilli bacterium]|nr:ATP-binding protein [Bacilli bacterium]